MRETILEMERYAEANNIPIIELDSIKFIMKYIKLNNVKTVLEIGTAIGYSAILMANATDTVEITTIEKDEKRYREAVKNVNACGLDKRIEIVYNDALEVFEVSYGNYVETIDINLRKELVMLGFGVDDVKNLKESSLPVYVYEDRSLSEKGLVILYYVTNSLRKFGISEYGVGTEFVFSVVLEESDFRCKNGLLNIPNWPKKAFVASWLCLEHDELRKMNNGFAIKLNAPLVEVNNEGLTGILISDFEDLSNVQMAKDGNFYYKNVLGITKSELEFANKF